MDCMVHGVSKSRTQLSNFHLHFHFSKQLCMLCMLSFQSCPTVCDPIDHSQPGSSVYGILKGRILEWIAMPSSGESS